MRNTEIYLTDIMESIKRIESFANSGKESFLKSPLIQDGIIRNLEIIGEAAFAINKTMWLGHFRQAMREFPEEDYRKIVGKKA